MSSRELRARILVALGVSSSVACSPAPPPEVPVVPKAADAGAPSAAAPVAKPDVGRVCGVDEVRESICGQPYNAVMQRYPFDRCPPHAGAIERRHSTHLIDPRARQPQGPTDSFTFDADATDADVRRLSNAADDREKTTYTTSLCCYTRCTKLEVAAEGAPKPVGHDVVTTCIKAPAGGTSIPAAGHPSCPAAVQLRGRMVAFVNAHHDECCYATTFPECHNGRRDEHGQCHHYNRGRAFRIDGVPVEAETCVRDGWAAVPSSPAVDARPRAAAAWAKSAAAEHASVAAFARLSLQLLALGAPAELLQACHVAALEEIEHARLSYGIASALAGERLGPAKLPMAVDASGTDLVELARETFLDGCVAEAVAALEAEDARRCAEPDPIRSALDVIARDEAAHATLAFRILAWTLREGGEAVRNAVAPLVAQLAADPAREAALDAGELAAFGLLDADAFAATRARAIRDVVLPCVRPLLADT